LKYQEHTCTSGGTSGSGTTQRLTEQSRRFSVD